MADLESELQRLTEQRLAKEAKEQAEVAQQHAAELGAQARKLTDLLNNPVLKWFMDTEVKKIVDAEQANALDVSRTKDERNDSAQRYDASKRILELLPKLAAEAQEKAREAFESLKK